jgi:hypothetical protein
MSELVEAVSKGCVKELASEAVGGGVARPLWLLKLSSNPYPAWLAAPACEGIVCDMKWAP